MTIHLKKILTYAAALAGCAALFATGAASVFAQTSQTYEPLAPLPYTNPGPIPTNNLLITYIPQVFKFMIVITVFLSVVYIILGGVQYVSTDSFNNKNEGREKIKDAVKGLLLAIVAYLILYTINPNLTVFDFNFNFTQDAVTSQNLINNTAPTINTTSGTVTLNLNTTDIRYATQQDAMTALGSGFTLSSTQKDPGQTYCSDPTNSQCTSLVGMHSDTIAGLNTLQQACSGCTNLVITGGTETGHADGTLSHESGFKADISNTQGSATQFNTFLSQTIVAQTGKEPATNGFYNITLNGYNYVVHPEGDHWDITVLPTGSTVTPTQTGSTLPTQPTTF